MKIYLIVLLGFVISCSRVGYRSPSSIILDDRDIELRENYLIEKFKSDPDYFFVNQETKVEIYKLLKKLRFRAQFEIFEEAFDRGMFRTEILESLMSLTRSSDVKLVQKYSNILFSLDDKLMDKALRILISDDISEAGNKLRDSYFNALKNGYFKHTDLAYFILSTKKGLTKEVTELVNSILMPSYFKINEDFLELAYNELGKNIDINQSHYIIFLLDQRRRDIASEDLIKMNTFVKSKQSLELIFSYFNFVKRFDLKVSKELVKNIAGLGVQNSRALTNIVFNYFASFKTSTENNDFFKKVSQELNFIIKRIQGENVDDEVYRTLDYLFEKSGKSYQAINRDLVEIIFLAKNDHQKALTLELIKSIEFGKDIDLQVKRTKQVFKKVKDHFSLGLAKRYIKNQGVSLEDLQDDRMKIIQRRAASLGISNDVLIESRLELMPFLDTIEQDINIVEDVKRKKLLAPYFALYHSSAGEERLLLEQLISTILSMPNHLLEKSILQNINEIKSLFKNGLIYYAKELGPRLFYGTFLLNPSKDELKRMVQSLYPEKKGPATKALLQKIIQQGVVLGDRDFFDVIDALRLSKRDDYIDMLHSRNIVNEKVRDIMQENGLYLKIIDQLRTIEEDLAIDVMWQIGEMDSKRVDVFVKLVNDHAPIFNALDIVKGLNQKKLGYFQNVDEFISLMDKKLPYGISFGDEHVMQFRSLILSKYNLSLKAREVRLLFDMLKSRRQLTPDQKKNSFIKNCAQAIRALF